MIKIELLDEPLYGEDLRYIADLPLPWEKLKKRTVAISGATGMIGRLLIDALLFKNDRDGLAVSVTALGRNEEKARVRFSRHWERADFNFACCDIAALSAANVKAADYVFHLASSTHPLAYATDPVGTVTANVIGTYNLLRAAAQRGGTRFVFASSVEIYGENRGDVDGFEEGYCGYINSNTVRAGYPESKRCGEALCQAYMRQYGVDVVIPRLPRAFGPTMLMSDSKAVAQFIKRAAAGEDIILKSQGQQFYSFGYVTDVVAGMLYCTLEGVSGEAYNIADTRCNITLRDLAGLAAEWAGTKVVYELPDTREAEGYSRVKTAVLDGTKLQKLGWSARFGIQDGIARTLEILRAVQRQ